MEELNNYEKIAVAKVLTEILNADNIVHENEINYMQEIIRSFGLDNTYKYDVDNLEISKALSAIREMSTEQKKEVTKMMGKMIVIDNDINYNEVKMYNAFCETCNIEREFNVKDYPDVTLSGPFTNPEDLL